MKRHVASEVQLLYTCTWWHMTGIASTSGAKVDGTAPFVFKFDATPAPAAMLVEQGNDQKADEEPGTAATDDDPLTQERLLRVFGEKPSTTISRRVFVGWHAISV